MAYDDKTSALELHIRVNGQNLSANSERYSANTLRLPSDPSWPKIPARRLINTDDIVKPPYVVTLTGTPRKGRSVVRTVTCQPAKSSQRCETHVPKRLPSFVDPRFKRQITRQEAEKPDETRLAKAGGKRTPDELDVPRGTGTLAEAERERNKAARDHASPREVGNDPESDTKPVRETSDYSIREQSALETHHCAVSRYASNEEQNPEDGFSHQQRQEANNRLLLMIDEKARTLPVNALNVEPAPLSALYQPLANYSIQIPVVTYHSVPVRIPNISAQVQDAKTPCECRSTKEERDSIGVVPTPARESEDKYLLNSGQQRNVKNSNESMRESLNSNISSSNRGTDENAIRNQHGNFNTTDSANNASNNQHACHVKDERNADESSTNTMRGKILPLDNAQDLLDCDEVAEEEYNNNNKEPHKEVRVDLAKRGKANLSKKAKSFFRKRSRLAIADSDYTLILPGPRSRVRSKRSSKICGRLKNGMSSRSLTNARGENTFEALSSIPLETQELLKESYWEYYRGLRRKIALSKSEIARGETCTKVPQECLPESRTLQQCSVLSCKINTTLQDPAIADGKLLSVSAANLLRKKRRRALRRTRLLVLKTIAFLGITVSAAVIFLPMIYEYFFAEEHDEDENMSYAGLTVYYITSSLEEAFGGISDMLSTFFLRPVRAHRKL